MSEQLARSTFKGVVSLALGLALWTVALGLIGWEVLGWAFTPRLGDESTSLKAGLAVVGFFATTLTFHVSLVFLILIFLSLLLKRRRLASVTLVAFAICVLPTAWSYRPRQAAPPAGPTLRLMSLNTKFTDVSVPSMLGQIQQQDPDILCVEDLTGRSFKALHDALDTRYPHRVMRGDGDLALYSKLPFIEAAPQSTIDRVHRQLRVVVPVAGRAVAVYLVHTYSPRTLTRVLVTRHATSDLLDDLKTETLPTVLIGDFNFTGDCVNAAALRRAGYTDAFEAVGRGRGSTWPVRPRWLGWLPGVRIDHTYISASLTCTKFDLGTYLGSDHLPIVSDVAFRRDASQMNRIRSVLTQ